MPDNYRGSIEQANSAKLAYTSPTFWIGSTAFNIRPINGSLYIGGRGTHNFQNVIFDIECPPVPRANGRYKMEQGFAEESDECLIHLPDAISDYQHGVPIFFGLHSSACAVGRRIARTLVDLGYRVDGVLCLESPLTGDQDFENWYSEAAIPTRYIRHNRDGVCVVPPTWLGYVYPGSEAETTILSDEGIVLDRQPFEEGWRAVENLPATLHDHDVDRVISAYSLWLSQNPS